jgi:hypothetical protein
MSSHARQGLPIAQQKAQTPRPSKFQSVRLFLSVWKENIILSGLFGVLLFSPTIANWWENWR